MRKSYRKINPMRLKFATASATGRTRCGEFLDQKDDRKLHWSRDQQKLLVQKWIRKGFLFLPLTSFARRLVTS
jgi:hypothetical protein